jgi:hypothetical protein
MLLTNGFRLGPDEIIAPLGAGGMDYHLLQDWRR